VESIIYEITDSRSISWKARLSGPTRAGALESGQAFDHLPEIYFLRFTREEDHVREITVDLYSADVSSEEVRDLLERQPEWLHEEWAKT
jgi:hypothetical protein